MDKKNYYDHYNSENHSLKIFPVKSKPDKSRFKDLHPNLLQPPFFLIQNMTTGCGKTTITVNMILRKEFYNQPEEKYFDLFIIISPTIYNCKTSKPLLEYADAIYDEYSDNIIDDIIDLQKDNQEEDSDETHILLLVDDMLGVPMHKLRYLSSRYRHYNISVILNLQSYKSKSSHPILRQNASGYIIGPVTSNLEFDKMSEELSGLFGGKKNFKKLYDEATRGKYNFLYLDLKKIRAYKNFTKLIWQKE
tara:strand:+ start:1435 stop:2181 length:747 start_codon:yes stop_codon:yes gene_type:complete